MNLKTILEPLIKNSIYTNDKLMIQLGITKGTYYKWLREDTSKRTIEEILLISKLLEVSPSVFLTKEFKQSSNYELSLAEERIDMYKSHTELLKEQIEFYKQKEKTKK